MIAETSRFKVPNLDSIGGNALADLAELYDQLNTYCEATLAARSFRRRGLLADALESEAIADATYQQLPEWARW